MQAEIIDAIQMIANLVAVGGLAGLRSMVGKEVQMAVTKAVGDVRADVDELRGGLSELREEVDELREVTGVASA